jgi:RNA 2',3'-cyclic 3'-phosphodiesterase
MSTIWLNDRNVPLCSMHEPPVVDAASAGCNAERASALKDLLARGYGLRNFAYDATRLHITLFNLGEEVSPERVALVDRIVPQVTTAPFEVAFDCVASWPDALVLLSNDTPAALIAFRRELGTALRRVWPDRLRPTGFTPHITLMRGATCVEDQQIQAFRWTVKDFALVHSVGGRYVELGRWTLTPPAAP